jgi:hypothetical protein
MEQFTSPSTLPPPDNRRPVSIQDWEYRRPRIEQLYSQEKKPLKEVMNIMEKEGF